MVKKILFILFITLILFSLSGSVLINYFNNGLSSEDLNFIGNQNITRQVDIYLNANVTSAFLNLSSYFTGSNAWTSALNNNLSAYYTFDNYTDDLGIYNLTNRTSGVDTFVADCIVGKCRNFTGGGDGVISSLESNVDIYDLSLKNKTLNLWFNPEESGNFILHKSGITDQYFILITDGTGGTVNNGIEIGRICGATYDSPSAVFTLGKWTMVTIVTNDTSAVIYINSTQLHQCGLGTFGGSGRLDIGFRGDSSPQADMKGAIDEIGFWNRTLSASEITNQLYNNGLGSTNNTHQVLNSSLEVGILNGIYEWNFTNYFNQPNNKTKNLYSAFNTALNSSVCTGGVINGSNCTINMTFHSDSSGVLKISDLQINWEEYIKPNLTIVSPNGTYNAITYVPVNFTVKDDYQLDSCVYNITIGASVDNANSMIPNCNNFTATLNFGDGNYLLSMCVNDSFGNKNCSTSSFTVTNYISVPSSSGGGGGGGSSESQIPVIGIEKLNTSKEYTNLEREALFSIFNNLCSESLRQGSFAIVDYSDQCSLNQDTIKTAKSKMISLGLSVTESDLPFFYLQYKEGKVFQGYESAKVIETYNLFSSVLGLTILLQITPPSVDRPAILFEPTGKNRTVSYTLFSNKPLKSCEVVTENQPIRCTVSNSTIRIFYDIPKTNFVSKIFQGQVAVYTDAPTDKLEIRKINANFRVYNLGYNLFGGVPVYLVIGVVGISLLFGGTFIYKKYYKKRSKSKNLNINKLLNYQ